MINKNLEDAKEWDDELSEDDILNEDMFSISNMSNMISMSSIPNNYMPNVPNIVNSSDILKENTKE